MSLFQSLQAVKYKYKIILYANGRPISFAHRFKLFNIRFLVIFFQLLQLFKPDMLEQSVNSNKLGVFRCQFRFMIFMQLGHLFFDIQRLIMVTKYKKYNLAFMCISISTDSESCTIFCCSSCSVW